jgi:RNA polymerase sigma-70 factor (ECF subfamily)
LNAELEKALRAIPEMYRSVVLLRDAEEMSTSETAALLEISESNVKQRLHRGRAMLRKLLVAA